jgi:nucleoside-diphosphate-sugar epimerase
MRILLAGATGVIGRRVVPHLAALGHTVTGVARTPEKATLLAGLGATPVALDLFDEAAVRRAAAGHDVIINLATHIPPVSRAFLPGAWRENDRLRRLAAANLADAALAVGAERFIQESFAPIYVGADDHWIDEQGPVRPARYNKAVLDAEAAADRITREGGKGIVLRFAYFYGPDSAFTLDLIRSVRLGLALTLGSPEGFVSSIAHDDAATAVIAALGVPAGVYNVADNDPLPRREFVDALARALDVPPPRLLPSWLSHVAGSIGETLARSQRISNAKLRAAGGWEPLYPSVRAGWRAIVAEDVIQV